MGRTRVRAPPLSLPEKFHRQCRELAKRLRQQWKDDVFSEEEGQEVRPLFQQLADVLSAAYRKVQDAVIAYDRENARSQLSCILLLIAHLRKIRRRFPQVRTLENTFQAAKSVQKLAIKLLTGPLLSQ